MKCTVQPYITASVFIYDDADLLAGCTIAPLRTPIQDEGEGLAQGKLGRRTPETQRAVLHVMGREVVVAITGGRLSGTSSDTAT
jgi:hypothetical protein